MPQIILYAFKLYPNQRLKEVFFSFFYKGWITKKLQDKGIEFCKKVLPNLCYPSALDLIKWHQEQGHDVYILTASSDIWLEHWCERLKVKLICTEFEVINGLYTGKIMGKNCYGKEKLKRINSILLEYESTYGYGDSKSDNYYLNILDVKFNGSLNKKNVKSILGK